jgi:Transglycosylase SLT domain
VRLRSMGALVAGFFAGSLFVVVALAMFVTVNDQQTQCGNGQTTNGGESTAGASQIPPELFPLYRQAAARYRLGPSGWAWLASINAQETDVGRDLQTSSAGAVGWMQFMPQTWAIYGVDAHGNGRKDPNDPADAIYGAANYLHASGAPRDWHRAVFVYGGGAEWYFAQVAQRAQTYLADPAAIANSTPTGAPSLRAPALALAAGDQTVGLTVTGYTSVFNDHGTASGIPADGPWPGIAVLDTTTLGGYWKVTYPNGRTLVLQQIDVGPAPGLGPGPEHRVVDADTAAAIAAGYTIASTPTDRGMVSATYLGQDQRFAALDGQVVDASLPAGQDGAGCMPQDSATGVAGGVAAAADQLAAMHVPYNYCGGHITPARPTGGQDGTFLGLDCSSAVSWVLQHAGLRLPTITSGEFMTWGDPGPGSTVSIYANPGHVFMKINGRYFGTSGFGHPAAGTGPAWLTINPSAAYIAGFVVRHPPGL